MEKNENKKFPYKPARIVHGKKPYISFYVWNDEIQKLEKKRIYKDITQETVDDINEALKTGSWYLPSNTERLRLDREKKKLNILAVEALQIALDNATVRMRAKSVYSYRTPTNLLINFLKENYEGLQIRSFTAAHMTEFLNFYQHQKKWTGKTRNSYVENVRTLLNDLIGLGYLDSNVLSNFPLQKEVSTGTHRFYVAAQRQKIKETISTENPALWLFCQFLFYTFCRNNEIRQLKVSNIEIDSKKIYIPAEISKNGVAGRVDIPKQLLSELDRLGVLAAHQDLYIFGKDGLLSKKPFPRYYYSKLYKKFRDSLKFSSDYTLYSWKHTGVVAAYQNGVDILEISQQCRHHDLDQTRVYLRGLGVYSSERIQNNFPTL